MIQAKLLSHDGCQESSNSESEHWHWRQTEVAAGSALPKHRPARLEPWPGAWSAASVRASRAPPQTRGMTRMRRRDWQELQDCSSSSCHASEESTGKLVSAPHWQKPVSLPMSLCLAGVVTAVFTHTAALFLAALSLSPLRLTSGLAACHAASGWTTCRTRRSAHWWMAMGAALCAGYLPLGCGCECLRPFHMCWIPQAAIHVADLLLRASSLWPLHLQWLSLNPALMVLSRTLEGLRDSLSQTTFWPWQLQFQSGTKAGATHHCYGGGKNFSRVETDQCWSYVMFNCSIPQSPTNLEHRPDSPYLSCSIVISPVYGSGYAWPGPSLRISFSKWDESRKAFSPSPKFSQQKFRLSSFESN